MIIIDFFENIDPFGVGKQFMDNFDENVNIPNHGFVFLVVVIVIVVIGLLLYDRVVVGEVGDVKVFILILGPVISLDRRIDLMEEFMMRVFLVLNVVTHNNDDFKYMFFPNCGELTK
jgi:hypothetical protein